MLMPVNVILERLAPLKSLFAKLYPVYDLPVRFAPLAIRFGPRIHPLCATYPDGTVIPVIVSPPVIIFVMFALVNTAFVIFDPVNVIPDKSEPVSAAFVRFVDGPTIYPLRT
jgi:hypothetical protein